MENIKNVIITALISALISSLVFVGFSLVGNQSAESQDILGALGITRFPNSGIATRYLNLSSGVATSSPQGDGTLTVSSRTQLDRVAFGGTSATVIASAATVTVTAAQVCDSSIIEWPAGQANASSTFPAAADLIANCLPSQGEYKDLLWRNTGAMAVSSTIFVAGASTSIQYATSVAPLAPSIAGGDSALIRFQTVTTTA